MMPVREMRSDQQTLYTPKIGANGYTVQGILASRGRCWRLRTQGAGTRCRYGGHVGDHAIVSTLDRLAIVSMLDNPSPGKVNTSPNATAVLLPYTVLIVLLNEPFHRAQIAVSQV